MHESPLGILKKSPFVLYWLYTIPVAAEALYPSIRFVFELILIRESPVASLIPVKTSPPMRDPVPSNPL